MLKVLVFDSGWGGEAVANYLQDALKTVEIVRLIDWSSRSYAQTNLAEICIETKNRLAPYINRYDLIVTGGYLCTQVLPFLRKYYPEQKFVGVDFESRQILRTSMRTNTVALLAHPLFYQTKDFSTICEELSGLSLIMPDCTNWEQLLDLGKMSIEILRQELERFFLLTRGKQRIPENYRSDLLRPDVVVLLSTHLWAIREELIQLFGDGVRVIDFRQKLLHDVCRSLNLLGVDGLSRY